MEGNNLQVDELQGVLLELTEKMTDIVYEKYTDGQIDQEELQELNRRLSEWFLSTESLLKMRD
jgi:hypothetical protein